MSLHRTLHRLLITLCLLAAPLLATIAFAEREAGAFGGAGGAEFHGTCAPKFLAGAFVYAGKALDAVMINCGTLNPDGTLIDVKGHDTFYAGGRGGGQYQVQACPPNALATGIKIWADYNNVVSGFILRCTSMIDGTRSWTTMQGGGEHYDNPQTYLCKKNEVGVGIYGRAGSLVDKLGLLCADNPLKVAATPAETAPEPCPEGQVRLQGACQVPPLLPGTTTGTGGGFIQMFPECPSGLTFDQTSNACVTAGGDAGATESSACPAGTATVTTQAAGVDFLNVRAKPSKSAKVVTRLPNGSRASVSGKCAQPADAATWCRVTEPAEGCVLAEFLAFGKSAGFAKQTLKPKSSRGDAGNGSGATFTGNWNATADDVSYSMSMTQNGGSVSGSYHGADGSEGTFRGKVKGNVLKFSWKQSDGYKGSGKLALAGDGQSFQGSFNFGTNPDAVEGSWSGTRN